MSELRRVLEGTYVRIKDVDLEDLPLIVELRTDQVLSRYLHPIDPDLDVQREWLIRQKQRTNDYYFSVFSKKMGKFIGTCGVYNFSDDGTECEFGRLISRGIPYENLEIFLLVYDWIFDELNVSLIHNYVVSENKKVVSLHENLGEKMVEIKPRGTYSALFDVVHFYITRDVYFSYTRDILSKILYRGLARGEPHV